MTSTFKMDISYTWEKLYLVIEIMMSSYCFKQRVKSAMYPHFDVLRESDFPDELQDKYKDVKEGFEKILDDSYDSDEVFESKFKENLISIFYKICLQKSKT